MSSPLTLRPGAPSDYEVVAALFEELATGDAFHDRARFASDLVPDLVLAERGGQVVGYLLVQTLARTGYVRHVVSSPAARRQGVGRALLEAARARFAAAGCETWCLNVKPGNVAARALYEALGMRERYASAALRFDWSLVERLPEPSSPVTTRRCEPRDDAAVEASFSLPARQLASTRALSGRVLVLAEDAGPLGVACFDPAFPGAFPFRARDVAVARALLEACRPHKRPELAHMGVVVEDHPELVTALLDHGAELRLEILHYEGPLS
jgi:ribosomal protein S18 acetylase RimI-like enzyme